MNNKSIAEIAKLALTSDNPELPVGYAPTGDDSIATKSYVDNAAGDGLEEAPDDGDMYVRQGKEWEPLEVTAAAVSTDTAGFSGDILSDTDVNVQLSLESLESASILPRNPDTTGYVQGVTSRIDVYAESCDASDLYYITGTDDYNDVKIYDVATNTLVTGYDDGSGTGIGERVATGGQYATAAGFNDVEFYLWNLATTTLTKVPRPAGITSYFAEDLSMNSDTILVTSRGADTYLYNMDGTIRSSFSKPASSSSSFGSHASITETRIVITDIGNYIVYVFDLQGNLLYEIPRDYNSISSMDSNENFIIIGMSNYWDGTTSNIGKVDVYNISDGSLHKTIYNKNGRGTYFGFRVSINDNDIVGIGRYSCSDECSSTLYNLHTNTEYFMLPHSPTGNYYPIGAVVNSTTLYVPDNGEKRLLRFPIPDVWFSSVAQPVVDYVDSSVMEEAPIDGKQYVRKDADWSELPVTEGIDADIGVFSKNTSTTRPPEIKDPGYGFNVISEKQSGSIDSLGRSIFPAGTSTLDILVTDDGGETIVAQWLGMPGSSTSSVSACASDDPNIFYVFQGNYSAGGIEVSEYNITATTRTLLFTILSSTANSLGFTGTMDLSARTFVSYMQGTEFVIVSSMPNVGLASMKYDVSNNSLTYIGETTQFDLVTCLAYGNGQIYYGGANYAIFRSWIAKSDTDFTNFQKAEEDQYTWERANGYISDDGYFYTTFANGSNATLKIIKVNTNSALLAAEVVYSEAISINGILPMSSEYVVAYQYSGGLTRQLRFFPDLQYYSFYQSKNQLYIARENAFDSTALGTGINIARENGLAVGEYNNVSANALFEVGNGSNEVNRSNALRVDDDGQVYAESSVLAEIVDTKALTTKEYVDAHVLSDAPVDTKQYARQDGAWSEVTTIGYDVLHDVASIFSAASIVPYDQTVMEGTSPGLLDVNSTNDLASNILADIIFAFKADSSATIDSIAFYDKNGVVTNTFTLFAPITLAQGNIYSYKYGVMGGAPDIIPGYQQNGLLVPDATDTAVGGFLEAPVDTKQYARQDGLWTEVPGGATPAIRFYAKVYDHTSTPITFSPAQLEDTAGGFNAARTIYTIPVDGIYEVELRAIFRHISATVGLTDATIVQDGSTRIVHVESVGRDNSVTPTGWTYVPASATNRKYFTAGVELTMTSVYNTNDDRMDVDSGSCAMVITKVG